MNFEQLLVSQWTSQLNEFLEVAESVACRPCHPPHHVSGTSQLIPEQVLTYNISSTASKGTIAFAFTC
jgi:hypothetical protein